MTRLGGWLFRHRTIIPLPLVFAVLIIPADDAAAGWLVAAAGVAVTILGETIRLWSVRYIGAVSRTRSERLGPLIVAGPFAIVRNPLYVGNIVLWVGFAVAAQLLWLVPIVIALLALEYHAIVTWEEQLLEARLGEDYRNYAERVPRWIPGRHRGDRGFRRQPIPFSWNEAIFSERGTLIAMALGYLLLWLKARS
jgi:protein-S-isoprenylcysteine O-methyltransferase Ste14